MPTHEGLRSPWNPAEDVRSRLLERLEVIDPVGASRPNAGRIHAGGRESLVPWHQDVHFCQTIQIVVDVVEVAIEDGVPSLIVRWDNGSDLVVAVAGALRLRGILRAVRLVRGVPTLACLRCDVRPAIGSVQPVGQLLDIVPDAAIRIIGIEMRLVATEPRLEQPVMLVVDETITLLCRTLLLLVDLLRQQARGIIVELYRGQRIE